MFITFAVEKLAEIFPIFIA